MHNYSKPTRARKNRTRDVRFAWGEMGQCSAVGWKNENKEHCDRGEAFDFFIFHVHVLVHVIFFVIMKLIHCFMNLIHYY